MRRLRWFSIAAALLLAACGGSSDDDDDVGPASGLNRDEQVTALDDAELGVLCDWISASLGGYGVARDCGGTTARTEANRQECMQSTRDYTTTPCELTVGEYEDCTNALNGNICGLFGEPLCAVLFECV